MSYSLTTYVHVIEQPGPNSQGRNDTFGPGDALPIWALAAITNPDVWEGGRVPAHIADAVDQPPAAPTDPAPPAPPAPPGPQVSEEGAAATSPPGPAGTGPDPEVLPRTDPEVLPRPTPRAAKDEWARYVLATTDRTEADLDGLTKAELIELADQVDQDEE